MSRFTVLLACMLIGACGCSSIEKQEEGCERGEASCSVDHGKGSSKGHLRGREIVERGKAVKVKGTLRQDGEEWAIVSNGKTYNAHFGKEDYRTAKGVELIDGKTVEIEGFQVGEDIAVCTLVMNGVKTRFRDKEGRPLWAGRGHGNGERQGKGRK